jgi:hypothetical protein
MKNFVIVSTYPESGSRNIGDQLITFCLKNLITDNIPGAEFSLIWRADSWDNVKDVVLAADHVFFACLAIRPNMHKNEYPYLDKIVNSDVRFSVIAAGTDLAVARDVDIYKEFSKECIQLLHEVNNRADAFSTRGGVSQEFCRRVGLDKARFSGDIAFYDKKYNGVVFEKNTEIRKIVISDPHRAAAYIKPMGILIDELRNAFPDAKLLVAQHGVSKEIEGLCETKNVKIVKIYAERYSGLDVYDQADLHVGFRVHGHVSALKRRKYSYLLEQDGRGCDYGVTIEKKVSLPCYSTGKYLFSLTNLVKLIIGRPLTVKHEVSVSPAYQLMALIRRDVENGFERFLGLEEQIENFNKASEDTLRAVLKDMSNEAVL